MLLSQFSVLPCLTILPQLHLFKILRARQLCLFSLLLKSQVAIARNVRIFPHQIQRSFYYFITILGGGSVKQAGDGLCKVQISLNELVTSQGLQLNYTGLGRWVVVSAQHEPYFTNDPIFRSCAMKRESTRILGFADILEFVCAKMFPLDVGCRVKC